MGNIMGDSSKRPQERRYVLARFLRTHKEEVWWGNLVFLSHACHLLYRSLGKMVRVGGKWRHGNFISGYTEILHDVFFTGFRNSHDMLTGRGGAVKSPGPVYFLQEW